MSQPTTASSVRVRGLHHFFGEGEARTQVLFDNQLDLQPGEVVIMTGKSGSGKTTLLTLIGTLRRVQQGSLEVLGEELRGMSDTGLVAVRRKLGFIFQAHNLFGSLTAYQNVRLALELDGIAESEVRSRSLEMLERLDLGARVSYKPHNLSGGQRQRVAIARAMVGRPKLVLADEPTAALDEQSGTLVVQLFRELARALGTTVLIVTHDEKILDSADRIVNMRKGRIISDVGVEEAVDLCEYLRGCPAFATLPPTLLAEVADKMVHESYPAGRPVILQGDEGDKFYVIKSGHAEVLVHDGTTTRLVRMLGPGDFFGEAALLLDQPRSATVLARGNLEVFALRKDDFKAAVASAPSFKEQLLQTYFRRQ